MNGRTICFVATLNLILLSAVRTSDRPPAVSAAVPFVATDPNKQADDFRNYDAEARPSVKEFYRLNHSLQTVDFVTSKRAQFLPLRHKRMGVWEAMEYLNTLVDDSDPDTDLSQIEHLLADRRGDSRRWSSTLVHPDRADPRSGKDPLLDG